MNLSLVRLRRTPFARPFALILSLATVAPLLPRTARADGDVADSSATSVPVAGFSDGSAGLSSGSSASLSAASGSGDAQTSYPFRLPKARGAAQPSLGLSYSSSAGVGFAGMGWSLNLPSIVRKGVAGMPKFRDEVPLNATSDDFMIDGALLLPVQTNPPLPAAIPAVPGRSWVLYRREIDDGARYFYDGLTWVQQTKTGLRQFGTPLDGGTPSLETVDVYTGNAFAGSQIATTNDVYIYRWNLVRDTDASSNTVFYVWDNESQLLGVNGARTAGTMFLTDIYDTPNTPNPTPPGPPAPGPCSGPTTRACDNCGTQTGTCTNDVWTWGPCENEGTCSAGATQTCGTNGVQTCSQQCQWGSCVDETCSGPSTQSCGLCGVSTGTCNNGVWSWSACQQPADACLPGTTQACEDGGTRTCTSSCTWGTCPGQTCSGPSTQTCGPCNKGTSTGTCINGTWSWGACQPPNVCTPGTTQPCTGPTGAGTQNCDSSSCTWTQCQTTGALLDDVLGLVERSAYAQSQPTAFAHHVHLTWALPTFPNYPTAITTQQGLVAPYAFSPIWKAPPFAQLTTVDVFSATETSVVRQLVREYQLNYTSNDTQTRSYLGSIQLVGDCDTTGGISEAGISAAAIAACAAKEAFPATTFSYYGISPTPPSPAPPKILSETAAYTSRGAADFLVDLNGDAVDDLVSGTNGMAGVETCLSQWASADSCTINTANMLLWGFTMGLFGSGSCPCPNGAPIVGPDQGPGTSFPTTTSNGLLTYAADDSMWAFSTFADWAATGRTSFLQTLPALPLQGPLSEGGGYTNAQPNQVFLGELGDPTSQATLSTLMPSLGAADITNIEQAIANTSSQAPTRRNFAPYNAIDVDGDGLPDMGYLNAPPPAGASGLTTLVSTRDRGGATHPFQVQDVQYTSGWESPSWWWNPGQVGPMVGGMFVGLIATGNPTTVWEESTLAAHAAADIDGDGLADEVIANKFRADWNTTMVQDPNIDATSFSGSVGWSDGPPSYVGLVVLPSRGDGRFGVPEQNAVASVAFPYDQGNYVTPGATAPFAPYSYPVAPSWPPYTNIGPIPPPQSDAIAPAGATQGFSMQSSIIRFGDLNGDGMSDYAVLDGSGLHVCLRYGGPWDAAHWSCVTDASLLGNDQSDQFAPHPTIMIGDVNGSGINRVIYFPAPAAPFGAPQGAATSILVSPDGSTADGPHDGLLKTVSNGFGGTTSFTYATVNSLKIGAVPEPRWVVTSVTASNGLPGTQAVEEQTSYAYGTPIYDSRDQMFVGFRTMTATTSNDAGAIAGRGSPGLVTKTTYATQTDNTCASSGCAQVAEAVIHASRFMPALVETSENSAAGTRFATTAYSYVYQQFYTSLDGIPGQVEGRPGMTLSQRTATTYPWDPGESAVQAALPSPITFGTNELPAVTANVPSGGAHIVRQTAFDSNDNVVLTQDFGLAGTDTPIIQKLTWALSSGDTTGWSFRLTQSLTGYADPTGTTLDTSQPIREQDFYYDPAGRLLHESSPLTSALPLPGPAGGARAAGQPPNAATNGATIVERSYQYDSFGNVTYAGNQDNACASFTTYDTLFAQLPASVTAYPNGCGTPGLTTSLAYDRRLDALTSTDDPADRVTLTKYDDFGRVQEVWQPSVVVAGAMTEVLQVSYADVAPVRVVTVQTGYGPDTGAPQASGFAYHYRYIDGLGETRAVVDAVDPSTHAGSAWTMSGVHASYLNGRTAVAYQPMFVSGPAAAGSLPAQVNAPTSAGASLFYDGLGRPTYAQDYDGHATMTVYRNAALSVDEYDAEQTAGSHQAAHTTVTRDGHGRVTETDAHWGNGPNGQSGDLITAAGYQATGELTSITQGYPAGVLSRHMTYDSLGRMVTNTEPNVGTWTYAYDAEGRLVGTSDARGCGEDFFYDLGGRLLAADYSPCTSSQRTYTTPSITAGAFPYPGAEESYAYDPTTGFRTHAADRGRSDAYGYDAAGHLNEVTRQVSLPGPTTTYGASHVLTVDQYAISGQPMESSLHALALANGASMTETTTYGVDGMLSGISAAPASGGLVSNFSYDAAGRTLAVEYGQTSLNGVTEVSPVDAAYAYDANGALTGYSLTQWIANEFNRLSPREQILTQTSLTLDWVGNPLTVKDSATMWPAGAQAMNQVYSYSDDYRLRQASSTTASGSPDTWVDPYAYEQSVGSTLYPQPTSESDRFTQVNFNYDWRGNVATSSDQPANDDFYDRSLGTVSLVPGTDRISAASTSTGSLSTAYDAGGNLTALTVTLTPPVVSKPGTGGCGVTRYCGPPPSTDYTYAWDEVGNLAAAQRVGPAGDVAETYTYSANGERTSVAETVAGATTYTVFVFDSLVLKDAALGRDYEDDLKTEQVYLAGGLAHLFNDTTGSMPAGSSAVTGGVAGNHTFLNLRDPRGSSAFVVDQGTGSVVERTAYLPYGAFDADYRNPTWLSAREDEKFGGHWDDAEVGLVYFGKRYYSPQLGRFISPDPLTIHGAAGDLNPYEYAYGNPIRYADPTGLDPDDSSSPPPPGSDDQSQSAAPPQSTGWGSSSTQGAAADQWAASCTPGSVGCSSTCSGSGCTSVSVSADYAYDTTGTDPRAGSVSYDEPYGGYYRWNPYSLTGTGSMLLGAQGGGLSCPICDSTMVFLGSLSEVGGALQNISVLMDRRSSDTQMAIAGAGLVLVLVPGSGEAAKLARGLGEAADGLGGASRLAGDSYEIIDGVRRAKAAAELGQDTVQAVVHVGGKAVASGEVSVSSLLSPTKSVIDVSTPTAMQRWLSVLNGTRTGDALPPIIIRPGTQGVPIPGVGFQF